MVLCAFESTTDATLGIFVQTPVKLQSKGCANRNILINNDIDAYIHRADSTTSQYFRNGYMKENGWFILLLSLKEFFIKENILEGVSKNFSRFAYIRICGCMNFNKCRFKSCEQLQIKTYNKTIKLS